MDGKLGLAAFCRGKMKLEGGDPSGTAHTPLLPTPSSSHARALGSLRPQPHFFYLQRTLPASTALHSFFQLSGMTSEGHQANRSLFSYTDHKSESREHGAQKGTWVTCVLLRLSSNFKVWGLMNLAGFN